MTEMYGFHIVWSKGHSLDYLPNLGLIATITYYKPKLLKCSLSWVLKI